MQKKKNWLLILLIIATIWTAFYLWYKAGEYFWIEVWFIVEILILTMFTRTVGWRRMLSAFMRGILIAGGLTALMYGLLMAMDVESPWVIGFGEELFKFLPVTLVVYVMYKKRKIMPNPSDWLILAVLAGAGFSMIEKALWEGISFPFTYGPHLGEIYFFPDALGVYVSGKEFGYIGHAAATGLVGMGVGLALWLKQKIKNNLGFILPAVLFIWVAVEHALLNSYYANGSTALLKLGGGQITPWLFIVFLVVVLAIDGYGLWKYLVRTDKAKKMLQGLVKEKKFWDFFKSLRVVNLIVYKKVTK